MDSEEVRALRLAQAALVSRLGELAAECAAQRVEISRLRGGIQRLEDDLCRGRGWLLHLGDRITALESTCQRLRNQLAALSGILRDTLSETVSRIRLWF